MDVRESVSVTVAGSATPAPEAVLRHRVAVAAAKVCEQAVGGGSLQLDYFTDCVGQARRGAEPQVKAVLAGRVGAGALVASASPPAK